MNVQFINDKILNLQNQLNRPLVKTCRNSPDESLRSQGEKANFLEEPLKVFGNIKKEVNQLKNWEMRLKKEENELTKKRIWNVVRLALTVSILAFAILACLLVIGGPGLAVLMTVGAMLAYTALGISSSLDMGFENEGGVVIGVFGGPFLMLYQTISAFRDKALSVPPSLEKLEEYDTQFKTALNKLIGSQETLKEQIKSLKEKIKKQEQEIDLLKNNDITTDSNEEFLEKMKLKIKEIEEKMKAIKALEEINQWLETIQTQILLEKKS